MKVKPPEFKAESICPVCGRKFEATARTWHNIKKYDRDECRELTQWVRHVVKQFDKEGLKLTEEHLRRICNY